MVIKRVVRHPAFLACISILSCLALFEGFVSYEMNFGLTPSSNSVLLDYFRGYYWRSHYRSVIQFNRDCGQYDPELFYRLKEGKCRHFGSRFENDYRVNHLGVRDSEEALKAPEVIAVGDSHTMGWGVNQDETYASLIGRKTGLRSLNLGISSYGTARELALLKKADLSRLKYLVIQYDDNDTDENEAFVGNRMNFRVPPEKRWEGHAREEDHKRGYIPGKNLAEALSFLYETIFPEGINIEDRNTEDQGSLFLTVLSHAYSSLPELHRARIVLFEVWNNLHRNGRQGPTFVEVVSRLLRTDAKYKELSRNVVILDLVRALNEPVYRQLIDNHLSAEGHRLIADSVVREIESRRERK